MLPGIKDQEWEELSMRDSGHAVQGRGSGWLSLIAHRASVLGAMRLPDFSMPGRRLKGCMLWNSLQGLVPGKYTLLVTPLMPGIAQHYEPVPGELTAQTRSYVQFVFGRGQI